jgi:hypothetical protein
MSTKKIERLGNLTEKETRKVLAQVSEIANELAEAFSKVLSKDSESIYDAVEKHSELVLPLLRKAKLWYFPSMPIEVPRDLRLLAEQAKEVTSKQIEKVFIDNYSVNNHIALKEMVSSWLHSSFFDRRKRIIEDALEAHISGKFTLSIPALLPQVEGILSSKTNRNAGSVGLLLKAAVEQNDLSDISIFNAVEDDILIALATDPFLFKGHTFGEFFTPEKYTEWVTGQGFDSTPLNRHAILHGVQIDYATEINSLRVFFLLDSVHGIDNEIMKVIMNRL